MDDIDEVALVAYRRTWPREWRIQCTSTHRTTTTGGGRRYERKPGRVQIDADQAGVVAHRAQPFLLKVPKLTGTPLKRSEQ